MPVPIATRTISRAPRPAPMRASATSAIVASLSTASGLPATDRSRADSGSRGEIDVAAGQNVAGLRVDPPRHADADGAHIRGVERGDRRVDGGEGFGVVGRRRQNRAGRECGPSPSTRPTVILVPPMSTPMALVIAALADRASAAADGGREWPEFRRGARRPWSTAAPVRGRGRARRSPSTATGRR